MIIHKKLKKTILLEQYNHMLNHGDIESADSLSFTVKEYPFDLDRSGLAGNVESILRRNSVDLDEEDMEDISSFINDYVNGDSFENYSPFMIVSDQAIIVLAICKDQGFVDSFVIDFALGNYFPNEDSSLL